MRSNSRLWTDPSAHAPLVGAVAIPVRDEEERIVACLEAIGRSIAGARGVFDCSAIVLLLNNCTDDTRARAESIASRLPSPLIIEEVALPPARSHAGAARRMAAERAMSELRGDDVVLMTDADSEVAADWALAQARAFRAGADVVAGRVAYDARDMVIWPDDLRRRDADEELYRGLLARLGHLVSPDPDDPWPRHDHASGASLAFRVSACRAMGGLPEITVGEDRAFIAAAKRAGWRVRHDGDVAVKTSGRLKGRAVGGAADTISARAQGGLAECDDRLEPVQDALRRYRWRASMRAAFLHRGRSMETPAWIERLQIAVGDACAMQEALSFNAFWQMAEDLSPRLARRPLALSDLGREIVAAQEAIDQIELSRRRQTSIRNLSRRSDAISCAKAPISAPNIVAASSPLSG